ncbi:hypothetical protein [Deinococcus pimensis]|uniref:hypothetical protein n=1 Tax=Deinococcus pimensis TaxID=309888 RepID=UPI00048530F4|nr:hypothetical protein [Deinococcus pimensis]
MARRKRDLVAFAMLRSLPGSRVQLWVVEACPLCGRSHFHPAGGRDDDPRERLGSVKAPCEPDVTYELTQAPRPRKEDRRAKRRQERRDGRRGGREDDEW